MNISFQDKVAVVTGAGSGIGFACAELLAASGAKVAMLGRSPEKIRAAADLLSGQGTVKPYPLDVTDGVAVQETMKAIRSELGEIDCLIQSAGRAIPPTPDQVYENWTRALDLNATSAYRMMLEVVEQSMLPRRQGSIVNVASMAGIRGMMPPLDNFGYSAGKAALISMTRQGAVAWGKYGVRVNAVAPGGVASGGVGVSDKPRRAPDDPSLPYLDLIPSGRHSTAQEIAAAICFLASDWSANTTGQVLTIDGGASVIGF